MGQNETYVNVATCIIYLCRFAMYIQNNANVDNNVLNVRYS
jgi:hypothetical protein